MYGTRSIQRTHVGIVSERMQVWSVACFNSRSIHRTNCVSIAISTKTHWQASHLCSNKPTDLKSHLLADIRFSVFRPHRMQLHTYKKPRG